MKHPINARYFPGSGPSGAHEDTSTITPLVDGDEYFQAVRMEIGRTEGSGDAIYLLGWRFEANFRFSDQPNDVSELATVLAIKAAAGVDVRLIMPTKWQLLYLLENQTEADLRKTASFDLKNQLDRFGPHGNILHANLFRTQNVGGSTPLAGRVLLDYSGEVTGIHHQKLAVITRAGASVAFMAGIDFLQDRLDGSGHNKPLPRTNPARRVDPSQAASFDYYWHDIGVRIEGPAVKDLFFWFNARRDACFLFRDRQFQLKDGTAITTLNPKNDVTELRPPKKTPLTGTPLKGVFIAGNLPDFDVGGDSPLAHQANPLLRLFPFKEKSVHTTGDLYQKAIAASQKYVYIEDQYFSAPSQHEALARAAQRGVKIIAVLGGYDDDTHGAVAPTIADAGMLQLFRRLGDSGKNVAVMHVKDTIVHSKLLIVDDEFVSIGSANFADRSLIEAADNSELGALLRAVGQSRSTDSELIVGATDDRPDEANVVRALRVRLWAEHLKVDQWDSVVRRELSDLGTGLSVFDSSWGKKVSFASTDSRFLRAKVPG